LTSILFCRKRRCGLGVPANPIRMSYYSFSSEVDQEALPETSGSKERRVKEKTFGCVREEGGKKSSGGFHCDA